MKNRSYILVVLVMVSFSCQQQALHIEDETPVLSEQDMVGMTKLGKQLENPYTVANMRKALENLRTSDSKWKTNAQEVEIFTSHLYLQFKPKNEEEEDILQYDSTLILYDYPLDFEIDEPEDFYHDPHIPLDQPTYKYAAVEVDQVLPDGVESEVLAELYIPVDDSDETSENTQAKIADLDFAHALEDEALRITDNLEESDQKNKETTMQAGRRKWRPAGRIRVKDTSKNKYVGVEGAIVRARRWFTTRKGRVNAAGYFSCNGRFRRKANYSIVWERYDFKIRKSWLGGAKLDGPKKKGDWNKDIDGGAQAHYATIFRASYHYYHKNIKGLRRPPQNGFFKTQVKIRAYLQETGNCGKNSSLGCFSTGWRALGAWNPIKIYSYGRPTKDTYATTIHELAHASHWKMDNKAFRNSSTIVAESWARGVQWELTRMIYSNYKPYYFSDYTGVVEDMIDGISGYDQVSGYTIRQLEDALRERETWDDWKTNIKNKYNNATENNLESLFNYWD